MSIRDKIAPHLIEGETILWSGQPRLNLVWRFGTAIMRVLGSGLLIVAIILFIGNEYGYPFLFIISGILLLLLPDFITRSTKGTYYAVTNRRVISLFDGKGTNILRLFPYQPNVKLVELPIDTIKDVAIEKYIGNQATVIFADGSNFFPPPYIITTSDGDEKVDAHGLMGWSRPLGYSFQPGRRNNIFSFYIITKRQAEEIKHLIESRLSN